MTSAPKLPPPSSTIPAIVQEISEVFAAHRAIPFIGAGCSVGHLRVDWDAIRDEMAKAVDTKETNHLKVASQFVGKLGREGLAMLLVDRLRVETFDPGRGAVQLYVMGLNVPVMYTTNQDNLVELCYSSHGRPISVVIDMEHLAALNARDPVLYKYHGDCGSPASIVFCEEDYASRGPYSDHPLDIRLKSDALGKTFIFLGYSFRDPNVQALFSQLRELFSGKLPKSYLIQFTPNASFAKQLKEEFGVEAVSCRDTYTDASDDSDAFSRFMRDLGSTVVGLKAKQQLEDFFKPSVPASFRVVTQMDIEAAGTAISSAALDDAIRVFRGTYDSAKVPKAFQDDVATQFESLCKAATTAAHAMSLNGALFNLGGLDDPGAAIRVLAACCTISNAMEQRMFRPLIRQYDDPIVHLIAVACAFLLLDEWGTGPATHFYDWVSFFLQRLPGQSGIPPEVLAQVEPVFAHFYASGRTTYENPIKRAARTERIPGFAESGSFKHIYADMMAKVPKASPRPYGR
jgi:hypothetical protein